MLGLILAIATLNWGSWSWANCADCGWPDPPGVVIFDNLAYEHDGVIYYPHYNRAVNHLYDGLGEWVEKHCRIEPEHIEPLEDCHISMQVTTSTTTMPDACKSTIAVPAKIRCDK